MLVFLHTHVNLHGEKSFYFGVPTFHMVACLWFIKLTWHCWHLLQSAGYLRRAKTDKLHDIFNKVRNCTFMHWAVTNGKDHREWMYNLSCPIKMRKKSWCVCLMNRWQSKIILQIKLAINPPVQNHQIHVWNWLFFELPLCGGGTAVECGSPCGCKSGRQISHHYRYNGLFSFIL